MNPNWIGRPIKPYIGNRQLEPEDDSWECEHCTAKLGSLAALYAHARKCQKVQAAKEPEEAS
jgi:hypothetical protein